MVNLVTIGAARRTFDYSEEIKFKRKLCSFWNILTKQYDSSPKEDISGYAR